MTDFYKLSVFEVIQETSSCVSIIFDISKEQKSKFKFVAGQYLTIAATINGEEVRRAYSIFTPPYDERIGVTVKRVVGGKMSNYLNDHIKKGDVLDVMAPAGHFKLQAEPDKQRDHYFFAAGSGITPVMSMISMILEQEPKSTVFLLYGNRDEDNIIFDKPLDQMVKKYENQFIMTISLSQPFKEKSKGLLGVLGKKKMKWAGSVGRIDSKKIASFIQNNPPRSDNSHAYICGPGAMIEEVETTLWGNGFPEELIHKEYFTPPGEAKEIDATTDASLKVKINGENHQFVNKEDKTILDTLIDNGIDAPYSCTSGACSTCMAKVLKGTVEMEMCYALDDDEIKDGYILTCQAHPTSKDVEVDFDA